MWSIGAFITIAYVVMGKLSLMLASQFPSASPVWPPTGIAIAVLLLYGTRFWPAILVGAFIVNVTTAGSALTSVFIAIGNTLEGVVACWLVRGYVGGLPSFKTISSVQKFSRVLGVAAAVSATMGVATLVLGGYAPRDGAGLMWLTWWFGDIVGALTITPFILLWTRSRSRWNKRQVLHGLLVLIVVLGSSLIFFTPLVFPNGVHAPLTLIFLLPTLWVATRYGPRETITMANIIAAIAIAGTLLNCGPFVMPSLNTSLLLLQIFVAISSLTGLILAAAIQERRAAEDSLEQRIRERTAELIHAKEKDHANLQRLRATISQLPTAALLLDEHGEVVELNDKYCTMFGIDLPREPGAKISNDVLLEKFLKALLHPEDHMKKVEKALGQNEPVIGEEIMLKDGRVIVRDLTALYEHGHYRGRIFLYRDVTKERRMDRAKSDFMSLASHQLRTPLTAMRWSLGRLRKALPESIGNEAEQLLVEGQKAAVRMSDTINTMLKISKLESAEAIMHVEMCDLAEILKAKQELFRHPVEAKNQTLTLDCPPLTFATDVNCLKEILKNLLQNAVKYTPEGGTIILRARKKQSSVVIEVEDTGPGIPAHQQKKLFQKFFRAENAIRSDTDGTGLGLYLVALLTKVLRGDVAIASEEGKGTTCTVTLPLSPDQKVA